MRYTPRERPVIAQRLRCLDALASRGCACSFACASAFASGVAALLVRGDTGEKRIAVSMGIGMGLTFDEAALLLDMRDVYWSREGLLSVQLSMGTVATLGITILTLRILGRGERHQEDAGEIPKIDGTRAVPNS